MGQGQSSAGGGATPDDAPAKTDYYELLGVERQATDDEIKKAYRRKALELHPDRNYSNVDEATKLFADVQSAYEVLSDPQERAWYDSHRDVLLRGGEAGGPGAEVFSYDIRMTTSEEVLKFMMKFNGRLNFNDSPSGFYGGLQDFFQQLAKEEDIACQWEGLEPVDYPPFGNKDDTFEDIVRPFYNAWNGFSTRKTYAWKDTYRLSDAPDRRVRRLMERENKRLREDGVREFNDAVRSLVGFVRKRDPRYQENLQSETQRQKTLREAAAAQAARSRAANQAQLDKQIVPEWAKSEEPEEDPFSDEDEVSEREELECVVCNKTFKSEKQFEAHEKSKKHVKLLKQLKRDMKDDDVTISTHEPTEEENTAVPEEASPESTATQKSKKDQNRATPTVSDEQRASDEDEPPSHDHANHPTQTPPDSSPSEGDEESNDYATREEVATRLVSDLSLSDKEDSTPSSTTTGPKLGKAKQKRAKKAAAAASSQETTTFSCTTCGEQFTSKTKLFTHVKEEGHAVLKSAGVGGGGGTGKGGKGKKK